MVSRPDCNRLDKLEILYPRGVWNVFPADLLTRVQPVRRIFSIDRGYKERRTPVKTFLTVLIIALIIVIMPLGVAQVSSRASGIPAQEVTSSEEEIPANEKLAIIWTSGDREVALKMVFMYTYNARKFGWWKDITLVVWGPSAKLLSEDVELQEYIKKIKDVGVHLKACKGCSDLYGVSDKLSGLGVEVKYMGEITDYMKEGRHVLTF